MKDGHLLTILSQSRAMMNEFVAQFLSYNRANIPISLHICNDTNFYFCFIYDSQISYLCINIYMLPSQFYICLDYLSKCEQKI